jgi:8-oxo-dGTP diphosphatase
MPRPVTPSIAVDAIIELMDRPARPIVLIERKYPPHGWAIPGGFVDIGETLEAATRREALEETGLVITLDVLLGAYSNPARDPRGHTVTMIYVAHARGEAKAADDAAHLCVFDPENIDVPLAFDHAMVLEDYRRYRATGAPAPLR